MRISDWLEKEGMTQAAFAARIGVSQGRVSQICALGTDSLRTAAKIERATGGEVTCDECRRIEAAE
jgi:DNA-binding transcriptional regulator YdaS (Cro superfamily)